MTTSANPKVIRRDNVEGVLDHWREVSDSAHRAIEIDLTEVVSVERLAGTMLSTALLGSLGDAPLRVELPDARSNLDLLWSTGLFFALANRQGATELRGGLGLERDDLLDWRRSWRPGMEATWRQMLAHADRDSLFTAEELSETSIVPDLFGPTFAAFVDPHLNVPEESGDHPVSTIVWPWLDRLLPQAGRVSEVERLAFISDVGTFVNETVANISEHAVGVGDSVRSLVQVAVTTGGGGDRLTISVQDTGPGIPATARPKIDPDYVGDLGDESLLLALLQGQIPAWGRGRGLGLPTVAEKAAEHDGELLVASARARVDIGTRGIEAREVDFGLRGTVLALVVPLPSPS